MRGWRISGLRTGARLSLARLGWSGLHLLSDLRCFGLNSRGGSLVRLRLGAGRNQSQCQPLQNYFHVLRNMDN